MLSCGLGEAGSRDGSAKAAGRSPRTVCRGEFGVGATLPGPTGQRVQTPSSARAPCPCSPTTAAPTSGCARPPSGVGHAQAQLLPSFLQEAHGQSAVLCLLLLRLLCILTKLLQEGLAGRRVLKLRLGQVPRRGRVGRIVSRTAAASALIRGRRRRRCARRHVCRATQGVWLGGAPKQAVGPLSPCVGAPIFPTRFLARPTLAWSCRPTLLPQWLAPQLAARRATVLPPVRFSPRRRPGTWQAARYLQMVVYSTPLDRGASKLGAPNSRSRSPGPHAAARSATHPPTATRLPPTTPTRS